MIVYCPSIMQTVALSTTNVLILMQILEVNRVVPIVSLASRADAAARPVEMSAVVKHSCLSEAQHQLPRACPA
jgi:hypothetical protein